MEYSWKSLLAEPFVDALEKLAALFPKILQLVLIFVAGIFLAWFLKVIIRALLRAIKFDVLSHRLGLTEALRKSNIGQSPSILISLIIYWTTVLVFLLLALLVLNVTAVDGMVISFFTYIPHFLVALFVFSLGYFLSRFLGRGALIALVNAQVKSAQMVSFILRSLILIFFSAMAIEQLGIARGIVIATFSISLGGVVLALAIAFGLGGKEMAKDFLEKRFKAPGGSKPKSDGISHL